MDLYDHEYDEYSYGNNHSKNICGQCKSCVFSHSGSDSSAGYKSLHCAIYSYPDTKPDFVIDNEDTCDHFNDGKADNLD